MDASLKIVIVDKNPIRAAILGDGLREAGHVQVVHVDETAHLLARVYALDPDVIAKALRRPVVLPGDTSARSLNPGESS